MLILLRHGRTPRNAESRLQGRLDAPLDEVGRAQARAAGEFLHERYHITEVVTSHLARTTETATEAGFGELPTIVDERWAELSFGSYDDRRIRDVIVQLGQQWEADISYVPPGGESMAAMFDRVSEACEELVERSADEDILVVTHATPVKAAVVWTMRGEPRQMLRLRAHLAAITVIDTGPEGRLLLEYNRRLADPITDDPVTTAFRRRSDDDPMPDR